MSGEAVLLRGHPRELLAMAWAGPQLVSLCRAGYLQRWDEEGHLLDRWALPFPPGLALFGDSGEWVLCGAGSRIELFELSTARSVLRWRTPREPLVALAASRGFKTIAALSGPEGERRLEVWQPAAGTQTLSLQPPTGLRRIFLDDRGTLLCGLGRGGMRSWRLPELLPQAGMDFAAHLTSADSCGVLVALGEMGGSVRVLDPVAGALRWQRAGSGRIAALCFSPGRARRLAWQDRGEGCLRVHQATSGAVLGSAETREEVTALSFDEPAGRLASGHSSGSLGLWHVRPSSSPPLQRTAVCPALENPVTALAFSPDGQKLAVGESVARGEVVLWDLARGAPGRLLLEAGLEEVSHLACSLRGQLACFARPGRAVVYPPGGEGPPRVINLPDPGAVALSPGGDLLAHRERSGNLLLWNLADGTLAAELPSRRRTWISGSTLLPELSSGVRFSPDGRVLYSTEDGPWLRVWEPGPGSSRRVHVEGASGRLHLLAVSERWLAIWEKRRVHLLERRTLAGAGSFEVGAGITGAISPCEGLLAVGYPSGELRIYACDGRPVRELHPHRDQVTALAFSPDGELLASGSLDGTTLLWQGSAREPLATLVRIPPEDWIVTEPSGRYDASERRGWLRWRKHRRLVAPPAPEPGLLPLLLTRGRRPPAPEEPAAPGRREDGSTPPDPPPPSGS